MPRYKITLGYDGTAYEGQQRQTNTYSIQQETEVVMEKTEGNFIRITASERTDAHVHALGQVFHFDSAKNLAPENWRRALSSLLPHNIRIQDVCLMESDFHARFHAVSKRYDYLITADVNNPFYYHYMGKDRKMLNVKCMNECTRVLLETHDFTSFTSSKLDPCRSKVRTTTHLDTVQEEHTVRLTFEGNGLLRYMVHMIAQTLIGVGKRRLDVADVKQALCGQNKHLCRYKAQAEELYLVHVTYADTKETEE